MKKGRIEREIKIFSLKVSEKKSMLSKRKQSESS